MSAEVTVAVVSLIGTLAGTFAGILTSTKLTTYRIEQLEKKVEKHNKVVERVYTLEKEKAVFEKELEETNHKVEDLEKYHKN